MSNPVGMPDDYLVRYLDVLYKVTSRPPFLFDGSDAHILSNGSSTSAFWSRTCLSDLVAWVMHLYLSLALSLSRSLALSRSV
eukprot:3571016-Rhodomonas_salina.1